MNRFYKVCFFKVWYEEDLYKERMKIREEVNKIRVVEIKGKKSIKNRVGVGDNWFYFNNEDNW